MARQLITQRILPNGAMASTNTIYSAPFGLDAKATLQLSWSGSPTGSWRILVSNSHTRERLAQGVTLATAIAAGEYHALGGMSAVAISGTSPDIVEINAGGYGDGGPWETAVFEYTNASGSGTLQVDLRGPGRG